MILFHLLSGLIFGAASIIYSIYAAYPVLIGLGVYSVAGAAGMLVSAALLSLHRWMKSNATARRSRGRWEHMAHRVQ